MELIPTLQRKSADIPATLRSTGAVGFWSAVILTGAGAGVSAVALTMLLQKVQQFMWPGPDLLDAATHSDAWRHIWVLLIAGALTGRDREVATGTQAVIRLVGTASNAR